MSSLPKNFDVKKLRDSNYRGEDFSINRDLVENPFNKRKCTDCLCGLVFIAYISTLIAAAVYGYQNGHPGELLAPIAPGNQICGYSEGHEAFPYLYIYDIKSALTPPFDFFGLTTCVKECPDDNIFFEIECSTAEVCNQGYTRYSTFPVLGYCVPDADTPGFKEAEAAFLAYAGGSPLYDVYKTRWFILGSVLVAIVNALLYIKFMDWCAMPCAWISVLTVAAGLVGIGTSCWLIREASMTKQTINMIVKQIVDNLSIQITSRTMAEFFSAIVAGDVALMPVSDYDVSSTLFQRRLQAVLWYAAIFFWVISLVYILCLLCNQHSLRVSIRIIEVAGDFVADTKRVLIVPILFFSMAVVATAVWAAGYVCVASLGTFYVESQALQLKSVENSDMINYVLWAMIFGYFWIIAFILACNEFIIIVSTATWYFSDKTVPDDDGIDGEAEVYKGFYWLFRYHFGSLALGSLLIAIVWMVRFVFEYFSKKLEKVTGEDNCFTKAFMRCIECFLACFDRMMRYLTRNAYIYMAISSESFCSSALNSFILVLKNASKFAFV